MNDSVIEEIPSRRRSSMIVIAGTQTMVLLSIINNLVLMPVYLRYIDDAMLGSWMALIGAAAFIGLADFGVGSLLTQRTATLLGGNESEGLAKTIVSGLTALVGLATAAFALFFVIAPFVPQLLGFKSVGAEQLTLAFRLACLNGALMLVLCGVGAILLGVQRPKVYMFSMVLAQIVCMAVTLGLLYVNAGIIALPIGMLSGTITAFAVTVTDLVVIVRSESIRAHLKFDARVFKYLLKSSSALFTAKIFKLASTQCLGLLVAFVVGASYVVIFEITRKAALMVVDIGTKVIASIFPGLAHLSGADELEKFHHIGRLTVRLVLFFGLIGAGGILLLNHEFVRLWVGDQYYGGAVLTGLICLHALFQLLNALTYNIIFAKGLIRPVIWASFWEAALQIALSVPFGRMWGLSGIVVASIIGTGVGLCIQGAWAIKTLGLFPFSISPTFQGLRYALVGIFPLVCAIILSGLVNPKGLLELCALGFVYVGVGCIAIMFDNDIRKQIFRLRYSIWR